MSTPARAVRKLAEPLAVKKKRAADAKAEAILGRCICAVRRTRSIFRRSCRWRKGLNSAVRTKAARRPRRVVVSQIFGLARLACWRWRHAIADFRCICPAKEKIVAAGHRNQ